MSHFTVLVIGKNPEKQLAPFHEFECTGEDNEFVQDVDTTEEVLEHVERERKEHPEMSEEELLTKALSYWGWDEKTVTGEDQLDLAETHKYGYAVVVDGKLVKAVNRTNPNKWLLCICPGVDTNPTNHAKGNTQERSTGNKVLPALPNDQTTGGVLSGIQKQRREVHVLQALPQGQKQTTNAGSAASVAHPTEVCVNESGILGDVREATGEVRDLQSAGSQQPEDVGGPLPLNWESATASMQELQYGTGKIWGRCEQVDCGNRLPHPPHVVSKTLIGGTKWDWYSLGGRWTRFFKIKEGEHGTQESPGLMTEACKPGYADSAQLDWIDVEGMRDEAGSEAATKWDLAMEIIGDTPRNEDWNSLRERFVSEGKTIDQAREAYREQPRVKAWNDDKRTSQAFGFFTSPEDFAGTHEDYIQKARDGAISTFAVLKDGKWYERGSMGWWGCVSDEKDTDTWGKQFASLLDGLPGDTRLSVYDCHI